MLGAGVWARLAGNLVEKAGLKQHLIRPGLDPKIFEKKFGSIFCYYLVKFI
jgi:hypothetical protein